MPKTKISEFSATPGNNTDIDGINIAEGCPPSGINDAIRELMAQLKDFQAGTAGDSFNGPVGTTTPAAGAFTNLSASGTFALTGDQVQISEGGTGQTTANAAFNALAPSQSTHAGKYLKTDGTNTSWDAIEINTADITGTLPIANGGTGLTALGTGVQTALGIAVGSAGAFVVNGGALGTPSSGTVTNLTGTASININGTVGATTPTTGAFTTLSASGNITVSGGTANGVAYLNGSKVLTTGSALTFDGTTFAVNSAASIGSSTAKTKFYSDSTYNGIFNGASLGSNESIYMGGGMQFFYASGSEQMRLTSTGLGIGTSSPSSRLVVSQGSGAFQAVQIVSSNPAEDAGLRFQGGGGNAFRIQQPSGARGLFFYDETATTTRMTIDASGNVGIGTSSPGAKLTVFSGADGDVGFFRGGSTRQVQIGTSSTAGYINTDNGSAGLEIRTQGTARMYVDNAGNLGLGVTPSAWGSAFKVLQLANGTSLSNNGQTSYYQIGANNYFDGTNYRYIASNFAGFHRFSNAGAYEWHTAPSGTAGNAISFTQAMTLDASGNLLAGLTSPLYGTTNRVQISANGSATAIMSVSHGGLASQSGYMFWDGANLQVANNSASGALIFGTNVGTERARITSGGYFKASNAGTYYNSGGSQHELRSSFSGADLAVFSHTSSTDPYGVYLTFTAASPNNTTNYFLYCSDSTAQRATIRSNGGLANYSANNVNLSDRREKTNFAPAKDYLDTICAIPVQTFNYIDQSEDDPGLTLGVVAQDVQAVAPELVMESNWGTKDDPKMRLSIYQTDLQYALMKCIQELKAQNDDLRARVAQLEAK